jgi:hypothetical protein
MTCSATKKVNDNIHALLNSDRREIINLSRKIAREKAIMKAMRYIHVLCSTDRF